MNNKRYLVAIFITVFLSRSVLAASGSGPGPHGPVTPPVSTVQKVLLDDFRGPVLKWSFANGSEFPGAQGSLALAQGHMGRCAALSYDFRTPATVNGKTVYGHYVAASLHSLNIAKATAISFWAKSELGIEIGLRVLDATNQTLQYSIARPLQAMNANDWYSLIVPLDQQRSWWGGANDGVLHFPIKGISVLAANPPEPQLTSGVLYFNNVWAITTSLTVDLGLLKEGGIRSISSFKNPLDVMGVCIHSLTDTRLLDIAKSAGFRWIRRDYFWDGVEKTKGAYDFSAYDSFLNQLWIRGLAPLFIFDYGNTLYTGKNSDHFPPVTLEAITGWGNYVSATFEHFKGRGVHYEVWNEENGGFWPPAANAAQYDTILNLTLEDALALDPQAQVTSGGLAGFDFSYLNAFYPNSEMKTKGYAVGIHPYRMNGPEANTDPYLLMNSIVSPLPPSITEWGYSSQWYNTANGHDPLARATQARMVVREMMTGWLLGSTIVIYYDLIDDGTNASNAEHNFGLIDANYTDKPAMTAIRAMKSQLQGRNFEYMVPVTDASLNILRFSGNDTLYVVWEQNPNSEIHIKLPLGAAIEDMYGNPILPEMDASRRVLMLDLNESQGPVYVHVKSVGKFK